MSTVLNELLSLLTLEPAGKDVYIGQAQDLGYRALFGGHVVSQALVAAGNTCDNDSAGRAAHSLHAYFIRAGDSSTPIHYHVERLRDGGSFSVRHVTARQNGQSILALSASFQTPMKGFEHQSPMPDVPPPDDVTSELELALRVADKIPERIRATYTSERPIEFRRIDPINPFAPKVLEPRSYAWFRATGPMPDDAALHRNVLAYASDFGLMANAMRPHAISFYQPDMQTASLDHAMWFYRDFRIDDWLLYACDSPTAAGARGLSRAWRKRG
jgi:acyl-CoA thioesterase II